MFRIDGFGELPAQREELPTFTAAIEDEDDDEDDRNSVNAASKVETDPPRLGPDPGNKPDPAGRFSENRCRV